MKLYAVPFQFNLPPEVEMKLNYVPNYQTVKANNSKQQTDMEHPLAIPEYHLAPQKYLDYAREQHVDHTYWRCPAWQEYWKDTYIVFNQIDVNFKYDKQTGLLYEASFPINRSMNYIYVQEGHTKDMKQGAMSYDRNVGLVIQWAQSMMVWPERTSKNLWVELVPYPETHHKTGMELITAEFPLGRWHRSINGAFICHAPDTKVPRGTPLYMIKFRGGRDHKYDLEMAEEVPNNIARQFKVNHGLKNWLPKKSWGMMKNDVEESKCPFSFLWKK